MPRTAEVEIYQFDELSKSAKERARQWYRDGMNDDQWWGATYEDAEQCAEILGIDIGQRSYKTMGGGTGHEAKIYFSGFSSQGDGACFEGRYAYAKCCARNIRRHAPLDEKLHAIADRLLAVQKKYHYSLVAAVKQSGHYSHEYCTEIDTDCLLTSWDGPLRVEDHDELADILRDYMRWIYRQLEGEWDYLNSDEQVDESILANEYEFDEDGDRWRN